MPLFVDHSLQALGVFGICQLYAFVNYLRSKMTPDNFQILFQSLIFALAFAGIAAGVVATLLGSEKKFLKFVLHKKYFCVVTYLIKTR